MAQQPAVLQTSWLRVEGPKDAQSCAWCARWIGRVIPVEMGATYGSSHQAGHACRCKLEHEELRPDPEDPGCAWG